MYVSTIQIGVKKFVRNAIDSQNDFYLLDSFYVTFTTSNKNIVILTSFWAEHLQFREFLGSFHDLMFSTHLLFLRKANETLL